MRIVLDEKAKEYLILNGYDEKYGARPLRRAIEKGIEDRLAEEILRGRVKKGETVKITSDGRKLIFSGLSEVSKVAKGTEL